jgi:uncharacterized YigZ family protein
VKFQPFKTIAIKCESTFKEKKSVFIAKVFPVSSETEVDKILEGIKKEFYNASHRCYAYKLLNGKVKFSDAGEPSGTAGIRILNAIDHHQLLDCLIVVIRYYGGIKLGVGPLGKAYYAAAIAVLSNSKIITKQPYYHAELNFHISQLDKIMGLVHSHKIKVLETDYDADVKIKCLVSVNSLEAIKQSTLELFHGDIVFHVGGSIIYK